MPDRDRVKEAVDEAGALPVEERDKGYYASKVLFSRKGGQPDAEFDAEGKRKQKPKTFIQKLREKMGLAEIQAESLEK